MKNNRFQSAEEVKKKSTMVALREAAAEVLRVCLQK
jgi:hypothetical protein